MSDNNKSETEDSDLLETGDTARTKEAYSLNLSSNPLYTNMVSSSFKGSNSPTSPKTQNIFFLILNEYFTTWQTSEHMVPINNHNFLERFH